MKTGVQIGVGILAVLASVMASGDAPSVCGTLAGKEYSVSRTYLFFWPEREGDSWSGTTPKITKCSDPVKSLVLEAYWPDMAPAGQLNVYNDNDTRHIAVGVSTLELGGKSNDLNLDVLLKYLLRKANPQDVEAYPDRFGLSFYTGPDPSFAQLHTELYWKIDNSGKIELLVQCVYRTKTTGALCNLTTGAEQEGALITLRFNYLYLPSWNDVLKKSVELLGQIYR
ncbi:hypothetical protein [Pseudomonas sp. Root329]|uniref:hypothetical protein n=1 Tax=Pseudomonas sp. Root329 TaxID=1736515 RepID=UPI000AA83BAD|nr:hypothetical protein [Pseudomonas sp. Root329]